MMNERNLKDGLDQIPQPFDKEALWQKIVEEKPKKRRPILWLWLLPGIALMAIVALLWSQDEDTSRQVLMADSQLDVRTEAMQKVTTRTETVSAAAPLLDTRDLSSTTTIYSEVSKTTSAQSDNTSAGKSTVLPATAKGKSGEDLQNIDIQVPPYTQPSSRLTIETDRVTNRGVDARSVKDHGPVAVTLGLAMERISSIAPIDIPELQVPTIIHGLDSEYVDVPIQTARAARSQWVITPALAYGREQHEFTAADPIGSESELEALAASLSIGRQLGSWSLEVGLSHTIGNTWLSHSTSRTNYVPGLLTAIRRSESTTYNLYNRYSRTDIFLKVGYSVRLTEHFGLKPNVGVGANVNASAQGHYFLPDELLEDLSNHSDYNESLGIYGSLGFDMLYYINTNTAFSVGVATESRRAYNAGHSIRPLQVHIGIARVW